MFWGHTLKERGIVIFALFQCFVCFERPSCSEIAPRQKRMFWGHTPFEERGIVISAWFQVLFISSALHVLGILVPDYNPI